MKFNPTGMNPSSLDPRITLPLLGASGEAAGNRQIQEELKRDSQTNSQSFNEALARRFVPPGVNRMGLNPTVPQPLILPVDE